MGQPTEDYDVDYMDQRHDDLRRMHMEKCDVMDPWKEHPDVYRYDYDAFPEGIRFFC